MTYGQNIQNDSIKITYEQETACLTCFKSSVIKDSIIVEQEDFIQLKDSLLQSEKTIRYELENEATKHETQLQLSQLKKIKAAGIFGVVGFLLGLIF